MTDNIERTLGVMGGMGPYATVDFLSRLIAATPGARDQDHIHVIIDHDPTISNRHESIAGTGPDVTPALTAMARRLEAAGADFLVMCCNTAHAYSGPIQAAVEIPFVSIIDTMVAYLEERYSDKVIGIVATEGCLRANLYQHSLADAGLDALWPENRQLEKLMTAVFEIKAGNTDAAIAQAILTVVNGLIFSGAEVIVSACTELPLVLDVQTVAVPLVDPIDILIHRCVALATGEQALPTLQ